MFISETDSVGECERETNRYEESEDYLTVFKKAETLDVVSLFVILCTIVFLILRLTNVWEISLLNQGDNARYFLSAVAQALASLFALVITISLIIMQLLTQSYTSAIFEIFLKRISFRVSLIVTCLIIIISLSILLKINSVISRWQGVIIDIVFLLVAFSVVWNIIYFFDLLYIVKPSNFLKMIDAKLKCSSNRKEFLTIISEVCDISMKKGDITTSNKCLTIFDNVLFDLSPEDQVHLNDILKRLFEKAIENDSTEMISAILGISFYRPIMRFREDLEQQ